MQIRNSSRRSFVRLLAAAPLLSQIAARDLYAQAASAVGRDPRENVYTRLGVKTVINGRGTWTYLSGSLEFPEVRQAQVEAAQHFVNMLELQRAVGRRLAELTGAESGIVTSGAAGAMAAATAGCMAGTDDKYIWQLPDTTGLKHEVIMVGGRSAFDSAIRLTGAKLVLTYSPEELANAINEKTAMIYTTDLGDKLASEASISATNFKKNTPSPKTTRSLCCSTMLPEFPRPTTPGFTPAWASTSIAFPAEKDSAVRSAAVCSWDAKT